MPKLIGMFSLPFPHQRRGDGPREMIQRIATDDEGQQWGLVERVTPIPDSTAARVSFNRWVRWDAIPFHPAEVVSGEQWYGEPGGAKRA
jgi:hypothetical protein